jgi:hypothetical protein
MSNINPYPNSAPFTSSVPVRCSLAVLEYLVLRGTTWKVRPRTSSWYQLFVEATRRNLILPDLPGKLVNGLCFPRSPMDPYRSVSQLQLLHCTVFLFPSIVSSSLVMTAQLQQLSFLISLFHSLFSQDGANDEKRAQGEA